MVVGTGEGCEGWGAEVVGLPVKKGVLGVVRGGDCGPVYFVDCVVVVKGRLITVKGGLVR